MSNAPKLEYLSPAEAAKALGVTVRALRVYEQKGLIKPLRTGAGWRAYGPEALGRLHQVLALKRLGLGLAKIAVLISGRLSKLDSVLELQEEVLARRRKEAEHGLRLVRAARARIVRGKALSLDDLITLTRETTMKDEAPDWAKKMQPIIDQHLSAADKAKIEALMTPNFDQANYGTQWEIVIAKAKSLLGSYPGAPEARDVARRWRELAHQSTGGDPALFDKMAQVWRESLASPEVAATLPVSPEVWAFVGKAMAHLPPEG